MKLRTRNSCYSRTQGARAFLMLERLEPRNLMAATPLRNDLDSLFLSHLDNSLVGASAESPTSSNAVSFQPGIIQQGANVGTGGFIRYPILDNIASNAGTIEFWIRPDWSADGTERGFFQVGADFNNGILLSIDGANNLRFILWGDDPGTPIVESNVERGLGFSLSNWSPGIWHHLAAAWNRTTGELTLYVDGRLVDSAANGVSIQTFVGQSFVVGAGGAGSIAANATFDEFRISGRMRSASEIYDDYRLGLGLNNLLNDPRGIDVDSLGRLIVAETGANRITIFNSDASKLSSIGSLGSGDGQFQSPSDVSVDSANAIYVLDTGNQRVQKLDSSGVYLNQFGSFGIASNQFMQPQGIEYDQTTDRIYVADTGNHRVQRFMPDGTVDSTWGANGVIGETGVIRRDHSGFDRPSDVAVNPVSGDVYVADFGNQRLEVFDNRGIYKRSFLAVYRANSLAFDSFGNLYIAGEDPNDEYTAMDGRLRYLKAGDELISRHYTGGLDDISRIQTGVAIRTDGSIIFIDNLNGRVVTTDRNFSLPLNELSVEANGDNLIFRWSTAVAVPSTLSYSVNSGMSKTVTTPTPTKQHQVLVDGLAPNSRLTYQVGFADTFDGQVRLTPLDIVNSGSVAGTTQFLRVKAVGAIYTDTQRGGGYTRVSVDDLAAARKRFETIADFYWRNSGFKLWLDIQIVEIDKDITTQSYNLFTNLESDLSALGFSASDQLDAAWGSCVLADGNFGGGGDLFGRFVAMSEWTTQVDFVAIHEVNHSIDAIYDRAGLRKYESNHGIWAVPNGIGGDFSVNGQILRNMMLANFTAVSNPFTKIMTAPDFDNDGVPDSSPTGLTHPLRITEATLGSSTLMPDSDGDGADDLTEATALVFSGSNLTSSDSDGDGAVDSNDLNPAYRISDQVVSGSPRIDGTIEASEGWTILTNKWGFTNTALVDDNNLFQERSTTYAAWDENYLYLALRGPGSWTEVRLDGDADNNFRSPANYKIGLSNKVDDYSVSVNVGVPDLFRQIDDNGQFSEYFDTNPQFLKPYLGMPFNDRPDEGPGFSARLVTEQDLGYGRGGSGDERVWEVRVPWSNYTQLRGFDGKRMGLSFNVEGDQLFSTDEAAIVELVSQTSYSIEATTATNPEGDNATTPFTFAVTRSGLTTGNSTVEYAVTGSDVSGVTVNDFGTAFPSGTVSFSPGEVTKVITINVKGDTIVEPNEDFVVTLSAPSVPGTIKTSIAIGTIQNDDGPDGDAPTDFGDAPTNYPVSLARNGARHTVGGLFLGSNVDAETDGTPSNNAGSDGDDDDGVFVLTTVITTTVTTTSSFSVIASRAGKLDGWIDFNGDGDWLDASEQIFTSQSVVAGTNLLSFTVPAGATAGSTGARFRLSTAGMLAPTGIANNGEVEDYLATIVTGAANAIVDIMPPNGGSEVTVDGADLVVRQGVTVVFKAPFTSFGDVTFSGTPLDDLLLLTILEALGDKPLLFDGGLGADALKWLESGKTLDLTNPNISLRDIESIDITGTGDNKLVISAEKVKSASTTTDTLKVVSDAGDTISFGNGWKIETPAFIDGQFTHIISEVAPGGTARVELRNGNSLQNPLNPFDADRDGKFLPLDALRVINELRRRGSGVFTLPTNDSEIGRLYFDVNGDNRLTALDALRIINAIARANRSGIAVGESASPAVDLSSTLPKEKIDGKQQVSSVGTTPAAMVSPLTPRSNDLKLSSRELFIDQVMQTFASDEELERTGMFDLHVNIK